MSVAAPIVSRPGDESRLRTVLRCATAGAGVPNAPGSFCSLLRVCRTRKSDGDTPPSRPGDLPGTRTSNAGSPRRSRRPSFTPSLAATWRRSVQETHPLTPPVGGPVLDGVRRVFGHGSTDHRRSGERPVQAVQGGYRQVTAWPYCHCDTAAA